MGGGYRYTYELIKLTLLCCSSVGYFIEPTIIETKKPDDKLMNEVTMRVIKLTLSKHNYFDLST